MSIESSYRNNPFIKGINTPIQYTEIELEEYIKCASDPVYFLSKYYWIVNLDKGLMLIDLYPFQKEIINIFHENKMSILKLPRQSSKTTITVGYILWASIFNPNYGTAILANKASIAREILDRYQLAYENLPWFLQQGVKKFNESTVELENGSKIMATATSISAIRGFSINLLFIDEAAWIPNNIMDEFFSSVYPTISSGQNTKFIMSSTPRGLNVYYKFWTDAKAGRNGFVPFELNYREIPGRDDAWEKEQRAVLGPKFEQEYACAFLGSSNTLISGEKLATLTYANPIPNAHPHMVIYELPIDETADEETGKPLTFTHNYVICVDVSEGKNLDYSAFSVFDVSTMPYRQVAIYRNNAIPPMLYPTVIKMCAEFYNQAQVLVEINNNPQVADTLLDDLEYENVLRVYSGNKRQQTLTNRSGANVTQGLKMSPLVKRVGCSTLKTLVENDKLIINDFETISELTTFVQTGPSWKAEEGCHDDLAMTTVIFSWMVTQKLFKDMVNHDIRKQIQLENLDYLEEEQLPIIEPTNGLEIPHFKEDNTIWLETTSQDCYKPIFDHYFRG